MRVAICVGEASGDQLAAGLIAKLGRIIPNAEFYGVAGPQMLAQGCQQMFSLEKIAVMGFSEVLWRLRELLALRKQAIKGFLAWQPDVFIGIDAPDFNLTVEKKLKEVGIPTVHYVSPTVWAWRRGRIHSIKKAVDLMLLLFPFEKPIYDQHGIQAKFVGHPLADSLYQREQVLCKADEALLTKDKKIVAVLPGSRRMEIKQMAPVFLQTMRVCQAKGLQAQYLIPCATTAIKKQLQAYLHSYGDVDVVLLDGQAHAAIAHADCVLVTSGTATLETMLLNKPMVVAYKMTPLNWLICRAFVRAKYCSIPNLLANDSLVPEFLQAEVTAENLAAALMIFCQHAEKVRYLQQQFTTLGKTLRCDANEHAVTAIVELLQQRKDGSVEQRE